MKTNRRDLLKGLFAAPLVKLTDEEAQATVKAQKVKAQTVCYERSSALYKEIMGVKSNCTAGAWFSATSRVDIEK
jgi:hypothetical protein